MNLNEIKEIKEILQQFDQSTLTEFELKKADFGLYLNKNHQPGHVNLSNFSGNYGLDKRDLAQATNYAPNNQQVLATIDRNSDLKQNDHEEADSVSDQLDSTSEVVGEILTSPIVGVVYLQPTPADPAFVQVHDQVLAKQTVCIIEAMKMMNEIPAGVDGEITEILVKNEQVIGIGDPLFRIKKK